MNWSSGPLRFPSPAGRSPIVSHDQVGPMGVGSVGVGPVGTGAVGVSTGGGGSAGVGSAAPLRSGSPSPSPYPQLPLPRTRRARAAHVAGNGRPTHPVPHRDERAHRQPERLASAPVRWLREHLAVGLLLAGVIGIGLLVRGRGIYDNPGPTDREADLVTQVVALHRTGAWTATQWGLLPARLPSLAVPQFAALGTLTDAWDRAPSALGAVRESVLALWVLTAVLGYLLARRIGADRRWALVAVALLAVCPAAIGTARTAAPENLALVWGLAGLVLATGRPRVASAAMRMDAAIAGCLAVAVLTAPVALGLLPAVLLVSARQRDLLRPALLGAGLLAAVGVGAVFTARAATGTSVGGSGAVDLATAWFGSGWLGRDLVTPLIVLAAALVGLRAEGQRPAAVGVLGIAALAPLLGAAPGMGFSLAFPVAAALVAVQVAALVSAVLARLAEAAERATEQALVPSLASVGSGTEQARRWLPRTAPALLTAVVALAWVSNLAQLPGPLTPTPTAQARTWLRDNVPGGEQVLADARDRVSLVPGTDAWTRVVTSTDQAVDSTDAGAGGSEGGTPPRWWISFGDRSIPTGGELIAQFGPVDGPERIDVSTSTHTTPDPDREIEARRFAGSALAASPQLRADPAVLALLRAGRVDSRAESALAAALVDQRIRLVALPPVPGEVATAQPMRQMLLAPVDTSPTDPGGRAAIVAFYQAQISPFHPDVIADTPGGVLIRYSPLAPPDLLAAFLAR